MYVPQGINSGFSAFKILANGTQLSFRPPKKTNIIIFNHSFFVQQLWKHKNLRHGMFKHNRVVSSSCEMCLSVYFIFQVKNVCFLSLWRWQGSCHLNRPLLWVRNKSLLLQREVAPLMMRWSSGSRDVVSRLGFRAFQRHMEAASRCCGSREDID